MSCNLTVEPTFLNMGLNDPDSPSILFVVKFIPPFIVPSIILPFESYNIYSKPPGLLFLKDSHG